MAGNSLLPWKPPMIYSQPSCCSPIHLWVPSHPSCPAEAPAHLCQEVPSMAMENMLEILRKSLKCSIFPGLQAARGEKCFLGLR